MDAGSSTAPLALSLSKGCLFLLLTTEEGQGFDRLSPNGACCRQDIS
jgi:hypothetical protein